MFYIIVFWVTIKRVVKQDFCFCGVCIICSLVYLSYSAKLETHLFMSGEHQNYGYSSEGVSCYDFYSLVIMAGVVRTGISKTCSLYIHQPKDPSSEKQSFLSDEAGISLTSPL